MKIILCAWKRLQDTDLLHLLPPFHKVVPARIVTMPFVTKIIALKTRRCRGFTLVELLVVIAIIGILTAMLLPAVQSARQAAYRAQCKNNQKQILLALQCYASSKAAQFPPGAAINTAFNTGTTIDPWQEAALYGPGNRGWSWMLLILPFMEQHSIYDHWDFKKSVVANEALAATDIDTFYCPARRTRVRPIDRQKFMFKNWSAGGNDYAGCIGGMNAYNNPTTSSPKHSFCPVQYIYDDTYTNITPPPSSTRYSQRGILVPNRPTKLKEVTDGLSKTIITAEVLRKEANPIWENDSSYYPCWISSDAWAVAGSNTLFDTALSGITATDPNAPNNDKGNPGGFNTGYFEQAGSDHPGGAFFGMADGSVQWISENIDTYTYSYLGCIADHQPAFIPQQ